MRATVRGVQRRREAEAPTGEAMQFGAGRGEERVMRGRLSSSGKVRIREAEEEEGEEENISKSQGEEAPEAVGDQGGAPQ